jgi:hypothetical protein
MAKFPKMSLAKLTYNLRMSLVIRSFSIFFLKPPYNIFSIESRCHHGLQRSVLFLPACSISSESVLEIRGGSRSSRFV